MLGNQKVIEINERVFRDVKNYLEDKEKHLTQRVKINLSRAKEFRLLRRSCSAGWSLRCLLILAKGAARC